MKRLLLSAERVSLELLELVAAQGTTWFAPERGFRSRGLKARQDRGLNIWNFAMSGVAWKWASGQGCNSYSNRSQA